jgi:hypothetical protein
MALATWTFHYNVSHRFSEMVTGLEEAAALKKQVQLAQLEMMNHYRQAVDLHNGSRSHAREAYEMEHKAEDLAVRIQVEKLEAANLHKEAAELYKKHEADMEGVLELGAHSIGDTMVELGTKFRGNQLAKRAQSEAMEAQSHLDHASQQEHEGTARLAQAEADLEAAKDSRDAVAIQQGLCQWVPWACKMVQSHQQTDQQLQKTTDQAIAAAAAMDEALQELYDAKEERDFAMVLFYNSTIDTNASIAILVKAKDIEEQVKIERSQAKDHLEKAEEEQAQYDKKESEATKEDTELVKDQNQMGEYFNTSKRLIVKARDEERLANSFEKDIPEELEAIEYSELHVRSMIFKAKKHVTHACWYALIACICGACLLALVMVRIIDTFRRQDPFRWIVRGNMFTTKDVSYFCNHILIFFLAMGFAGELLMEYGRRDILGRTEIVMLFALVGALFQVCLLHFIPNVMRLLSASTISAKAVQTLLVENVGKSGMLLFLVFMLEMLLCWVNLGGVVFSRAYKLNDWRLWIFVALTAVAHILLFENHTAEPEQESAARIQDGEPHLRSTATSSSSPSNEEDEETAGTTTLVSSSSISALTGESTSLLTVNLGTLGQRSTPYGSVTADANQFIPAEIASTFITSWATELNKVRLLFEFLIVSWALWIIRRDMMLIMKLSPLSHDLVWGVFPLWILDVSLLAFLGFIASAFWNSWVEVGDRHHGSAKEEVKRGPH